MPDPTVVAEPEDNYVDKTATAGEPRSSTPSTSGALGSDAKALFVAAKEAASNESETSPDIRSGLQAP